MKTYLPKAVHQFCWFHINCFHIGAAVHRAKLAYKRAVESLTTFDEKLSDPLSNAERQKRQALIAARDRTQRHWQGARRFQRLLMSALWLPTLDAASYNVHILRAGKREGNSLLASAHVNVKKIFGTDDPYTILGFPPASQVFTPMKSVQSVGG